MQDVLHFAKEAPRKAYEKSVWSNFACNKKTTASNYLMILLSDAPGSPGCNSSDFIGVTLDLHNCKGKKVSNSPANCP